MERISSSAGHIGRHRIVIGRVLFRVGAAWIAFALFAMFAATTHAADTEPPTIPTGVVATAISNSEIALTWNASSDNIGILGYFVESCAGAGCTDFRPYPYSSRSVSTGSPFLTWTNLLPGTSYSFRLKATDASRIFSGYSAVVTAVTLGADTIAPTIPTNLTAKVVSNSRIDLAWNASTDNVAVTGYRVERCQGSGCVTFELIGTPTSTSFSDIGRTPNTVYRYRVRANDQANLFSEYSLIVDAKTASGIVDCD